ncbi:hypothetical protein BDV30DRAFT_241988 [Aspergillus minisclerotigenes]|uniref:Uncharacterized protein n=1 Tax=Aspergillus minisclerotigenes TaxID=656917 RepID=A0A5N6IU31_9EURO|nr:hypothetical protein BDV30DRAFT_241988 [Aspergillus minisclerotigenes]
MEIFIVSVRVLVAHLRRSSRRLMDRVIVQGFTASTDLQGEKKFITIVCTTASCIM